MSYCESFFQPSVFLEKQRNRKIYKEEYQNLQTRQEILQEESASISKNISKLSTKMTKEKQQIDSISKEEENIQSRIRTLQQQCQALTEHRREYERNYEELDNQSDSEKKRLVLVKNSLKSVQEQIEKVRKQFFFSNFSYTRNSFIIQHVSKLAYRRLKVKP